MTLFNLDEARRLKEEGIKQAANNPMRPLDHARVFATRRSENMGRLRLMMSIRHSKTGIWTLIPLETPLGPFLEGLSGSSLVNGVLVRANRTMPVCCAYGD